MKPRRPTMDEISVFDVNPEMSRETRKLFTRFRVLSVAGLLFAMLTAALIAG
jgi:hypothetical protein